MDNPWVVLTVTGGLIALSAFFVVIEFALLGARRHRLEDAAATSRGARAALKGVNELTVMLAGAQLGITACTFALGAVTKPAVDARLTPFFAGWGLPYWIADTGSFVLSLLVVTFLHLVVGEMAPKSWAITHPETSAILVGPPARGFVWVFRPLLDWTNKIANLLVKASGVEPVDRAGVGGQDVDTIRQLVEHSANVGALDASIRTPISGALDLETLPVESLLARDGTIPAAVSPDATAADIQSAAADSGHMRILVESEHASEAPRVVHVRDTLLEAPDRAARDLARPAFILSPDVPVHEALARMRRSREQLAVVMDGSRMVGVVTVTDALRKILPPSEALP